jgi:hypothetical protein
MLWKAEGSLVLEECEVEGGRAAHAATSFARCLSPFSVAITEYRKPGNL